MMRLIQKLLLISTVVVAAPLMLFSDAAAQTRIGGDITKEMRLTRDKSPYVAYQDIYVKPGGTLIIEPGVVIQFKKHIKDGHGANGSLLEILVEGKMVAIGAAGDSIRFTSASDNPESRDWQGIIVRKGGSLHLENAYIESSLTGVLASETDNVTLKHVTILGCFSRGVSAMASKVYMESMFISAVGNRHGSGIAINAGEHSEIEVYNSFIVGSQNGIILYNKTKAKIHHTIISNSVKWGLGVKNSSADVSYCSITSNDYGIVLIAGSNPQIHHNNIFQNGVADVWFRQYPDQMSVDLSNNWWEKKELTDIQRAVFDGTRDPEVKAFAIIEPILDMAVVTDPNAQ